MQSETETREAASPFQVNKGKLCLCAALPLRSISLRFNPGGAGLCAKACRNSCSNSSIGSISTDKLLLADKFLQVTLGLDPQQLQSALQIALHRGHGCFEQGRNLVRRKILLIAKNQRRALRLRQ